VWLADFGASGHVEDQGGIPTALTTTSHRAPELEPMVEPLKKAAHKYRKSQDLMSSDIQETRKDFEEVKQKRLPFVFTADVFSFGIVAHQVCFSIRVEIERQRH
jgi:hypothetical protein